MIRYHVKTKTPRYRGRSSRNNPRYNGWHGPQVASNEAEVLLELNALRDGGAFDEGYEFEFCELYDHAAFHADPLGAKPFKVIKSF